MAGYGIFLGCIFLLGIICLLMRRGIRVHAVESMICAGGRIGGPTLTCSIFAAWMWTTSVFASAETYHLYGIWGPVSYVAGACIAFAGLIVFLAFLRRRFPNVVTWLGFIGRRFGRRAKLLYSIFAFVIPAYVLIEQGVGIAYVLETFYGCSFKIISFCSVLIAMGFVFFGGMKSVLTGEKIATLIIFAGFAVGIIFVLMSPDAPVHTAPAGNSSVPGGAPSASLAMSALRYFIMVIVIAFGQIVFDPAYYLKANLAKSTGSMVSSFLIGGIVLWGGITLASSLYMGRMSEAASVGVTDLFSGPAKAVFSVVIIFIGISTIAHYMIGIFGVSSLELYTEMLRPDGSGTEDSSDREKIVFGRILLVAMGVFCASMTIALENISLLSIDVFCAIFFAAPCIPLLMGCFSLRNFGKLPVLAVICGIIGGLIVWVAFPGSIVESQFVGMGASLFIPLVVMLGGYLKRLPFDN